MNIKTVNFPVGYENFTNNNLSNFCMNRWYSIGFARAEDLYEAGKNIKKYQDWKPEMIRIADQALSEDRFKNAAFYYRSAEFFTYYDDPDRLGLYNKFYELFNKAFHEEQIERIDVPYEKSSIPAIRICPPGVKKGTILLHGGMDSFLEEWYYMMKYLSEYGYEVIGFEGPGQGAALLRNNLPLDIHWELPRYLTGSALMMQL